MRPASEEVVGMLHGCSLRATPQRIGVLRALANGCRHLTAEQVYGCVCREIASCSLSTVYHALDTLARARLVEAIRFASDRAHYGLVKDEHLHFYCSSCGTVHDVPGSPVEWMMPELPEGFTAHGRQMVICGICVGCGKPN